jgi:radical SAM-linked protein
VREWLVSRLILSYAKKGKLRFLSHLEVARVFERAFRRARLPAKITKGFHPRYKISYGLPLPVGYISWAEYLVLHLKSSISSEEAKRRIARELPLDLSIKEVVLTKAKQLPSELVKVILYRIKIRTQNQVNSKLLKEAIRKLKKAKKINYLHRGEKKWVKTSQVIKELTLVSVQEREFELKVEVYVEKGCSLRPEIIVEHLLKEVNLEKEELTVERMEQFAKVNHSFKPLIEYYKGDEKSQSSGVNDLYRRI